MTELELCVKGMICTGCENRIKNVLQQIPEIKEVEADHKSGKVKIILKDKLTKTIEDSIIGSINNLDFEVENRCDK